MRDPEYQLIRIELISVVQNFRVEMLQRVHVNARQIVLTLLIWVVELRTGVRSELLYLVVDYELKLEPFHEAFELRVEHCVYLSPSQTIVFKLIDLLFNTGLQGNFRLI